MSHKWLNKYLSSEDLGAIKKAIADAELRTSGEIRVSLRRKRVFLERLYSKHELAVKDFEDLDMAKTNEKTGVLLFILFDERYYDILADSEIYPKINDEKWNEFETKLKEQFRNGNYLNGILHIIQEMGEILAFHFPRKEDDVNELSDEVNVK